MIEIEKVDFIVTVFKIVLMINFSKVDHQMMMTLWNRKSVHQRHHIHTPTSGSLHSRPRRSRSPRNSAVSVPLTQARRTVFVSTLEKLG